MHVTLNNLLQQKKRLGPILLGLHPRAKKLCKKFQLETYGLAQSSSSCMIQMMQMLQIKKEKKNLRVQ